TQSQEQSLRQPVILARAMIPFQRKRRRRSRKGTRTAMTRRQKLNLKMFQNQHRVDADISIGWEICLFFHGRLYIIDGHAGSCCADISFPKTLSLQETLIDFL